MQEQFNALLESMKDQQFTSNSLEEKLFLLKGLVQTTEMMIEYKNKPGKVWVDGMELVIITLDDLMSKSYIRLENERAEKKRLQHERDI